MAEIHFDPADYINEITSDELIAELRDRGLSSQMNDKETQQTLLDASEKLRKDGHIATAHRIDLILREES